MSVRVLTLIDGVQSITSTEMVPLLLVSDTPSNWGVIVKSVLGSTADRGTVTLWVAWSTVTPAGRLE